jgi:hypothetical protein
VDIDAPIRQHPRLSINPANPGVRRNNTFQALSSDSSRHNPFDLPFSHFDGCGGHVGLKKGPLPEIGAKSFIA